jgi:myo-inositol-1(or 4)-monophosphatase
MTDYLEFAVGLAAWATERMRTGPVTRATKANPADIVTDTDTAIERYVRDRIAERFPGHGVTGEELPDTPGSPVWYVDPVDGTTNYSSGLGWCSFTLALADESGPLLGVVADPFRGETFTARRGSGAFLNGAPIRCGDWRSLDGTVLLTELSGHQPWPGAFAMISALAARHCTVRVMGSSALSLATVAAGRAAAVVLGEYHPVDAMAGLLIAREAGAVIDMTTPGVIAAAPGVARLVSEVQVG